MTKETKSNILNAFELWLDENGFSANEFADKYKVPSNYISQMRNGKFFVPTGGKDVEIADKYFRIIAEAIGMDVSGKTEFWKFYPTPQAMQIFATLEDAKQYGYTNILIGETGCGKTYVSDLFIRQNPKDNFKVTVGSMDTIVDLLDKLCDSLKLPQVHSKSKKISAIIKELQRLRLNGRNPILIFDEAEFMKQSTLCNIKEFHDHLNKKCGLVLIGTNQLLEKIEKLRKKNSPGMPQFYRRVKYGIRTLKTIDTRFNEFLKGIEDKALIKFLQAECNNYGELYEVLVPSMREAERTGEELTEDFVRKVLNLPKL
ncbi:ATP-binding protein [Chryseobacterium sp. H3056]|uniref:ATP-binding protein n=1 Tax=Kaistella daneshvariae TaxID=2487074 RepID=A0A3N0WXU2_9FLAO|nr:ATP-binding protein [Kaistella daneshvariae]ROI09765.1 ATP-binding protein [Kaistella daneshvariae]